MKSYEDLTKEEKEKLNTFTLIKETEYIKAAIILIIPFISIFIGLTISTLPYIPFQIIGFSILGIGMMVTFIALYYLQQHEKRLNIIFGVDSTDDFFDIKKSDYLNMKKSWKVKK